MVKGRDILILILFIGLTGCVQTEDGKIIIDFGGIENQVKNNHMTGSFNSTTPEEICKENAEAKLKIDMEKTRTRLENPTFMEIKRFTNPREAANFLEKSYDVWEFGINRQTEPFYVVVYRLDVADSGPGEYDRIFWDYICDGNGSLIDGIPEPSSTTKPTIIISSGESENGPPTLKTTGKTIEYDRNNCKWEPIETIELNDGDTFILLNSDGGGIGTNSDALNYTTEFTEKGWEIVFSGTGEASISIGATSAKPNGCRLRIIVN